MSEEVLPEGVVTDAAQAPVVVKRKQRPKKIDGVRVWHCRSCEQYFPSKHERDQHQTSHVNERKPRILQYESDTVIALDGEGRLKAVAWLVIHAFEEQQWPRAEVLRAAQAAKLIGESEDAEAEFHYATGGRLNTVQEFQRACREAEKNDLGGIDRGVRTIILRLPGGHQVELNAFVEWECVSVDATRSGRSYQLNRRIKFFVKDIERTLAGDITKADVMRAIGAEGDTDHVIVQAIGKLTLGANYEIESEVYEAFQDEATGARAAFEAKADQVSEAFNVMMGVYTHQDIRNAWQRTQRQIKGSFPWQSGNGGITFVPARFKPHLDAWRDFMLGLYGSRRSFTLLPLASMKDAQEEIAENASEWAQREWDSVVEETLHRLREARENAKSPEKLDRALDRVRDFVSERVEALEESEAEINAALEEKLRVHVSISPAKAQRLAKELDDPRITRLFSGRGLVEEDEESPTPSIAIDETAGAADTGTEGQDRESYTDEQDRESYEPSTKKPETKVRRGIIEEEE